MDDLHRLDPTGRFAKRADSYAKYRPLYPAAAVDHVLAGLGPPASLLVADVGAGTGILSRLVADRGASVIAIEPNAAMRAAAELHERVRYVDAVGEATGLAGGSVDLVLCAQAFHWLEPSAALAEFHRVLRPHGRLALAWNERDRSDLFTDHYSTIIARAAEGHPALSRSSYPAALLASPLFETLPEATFAYDQVLDAAGLLGRAMSSSYVPLAGPKRDELVRDLAALGFGPFRLRYVTRVFLAHPQR